MANWRRITGAAGLVVGATAAGAGALVAAERIAVSRIRSRTGHRPGDEPFGTLRGRELTVLAHDGVALHVEINGPDTAPVTIIFSHGYTLNQDCWHFQRRDLAEHRLVFWDQRDHGRSGRAQSVTATIDQLGADLTAVIDAAASSASTVSSRPRSVPNGSSPGGWPVRLRNRFTAYRSAATSAPAPAAVAPTTRPAAPVIRRQLAIGPPAACCSASSLASLPVRYAGGALWRPLASVPAAASTGSSSYATPK